MFITNYGEDSLPITDSSYFTVCQTSTIQSIIPNNTLPINIISTSSYIKIISTHLFNTEVGVSYEGEKLSGVKLFIEYTITTRIKYLLPNSNSTVKFFTFNYPIHSTSIVIPEKIDKLPVSNIIKQHNFEINYYIEDEFFYTLNNGNLFNSIIVLFYALF